MTLSHSGECGDSLEFKITRGSWATSECSSEGRLAPPKIDHFPSSTASPNVHLLSNDFPMPQLQRTGRVAVYLPSEYENSNRRYPVLYMPDGQHLFDEATSVGRMGPIEWGVDKTLDRLSAPMIVVGVDHHPDLKTRLAEYGFTPNSESPYPRGSHTLEFLANTLKPHIDAQYRTKPEAASTSILGSSMAGMLALVAGLRLPHVFGHVGVFSPSLWSDESRLDKELSNLAPSTTTRSQRYFFYAGAKETRRRPDGRQVTMATDTSRASTRVRETLDAPTHLEIAPEGRHNALSWGAVFPKFYQWLRSDLEP